MQDILKDVAKFYSSRSAIASLLHQKHMTDIKIISFFIREDWNI